MMMITDLVSGQGTAIGLIRPFVLYTIFWTNWLLTFILCMCVRRDHNSLKIEEVKVIGQGQRSCKNVCITRVSSIYCSVLWIPTWRHQLPASAARRAAWRGQGHWQRRSPALVGVVTRSVCAQCVVLLLVLDALVGESRVCESEWSGGVTWSTTVAGRYDLQPCPPSFTGQSTALQSVVFLRPRTFPRHFTSTMLRRSFVLATGKAKRFSSVLF